MAKYDAKKLITRARSDLILDHPFLGALAIKLEMIPDPSISTASVDGYKIRYNPEYVEKQTPFQVTGLIAHEVWHCVLQHITRRNSRDPRKWNIAGDLVINSILQNAGFILPETDLIDFPECADMTTDHIYNMLPDIDEDTDTIVIFGKQVKINGGSDPGGTGGVSDGGTTGSELREMESDWHIATSQAAQAAKTMGSMPGAWESLINEILDAKVDWRDVLRDFITSTGRNDYSWRVPNRRHIGNDLILPSLYSEEIGHIVVATDTSGSVSNEEIQQFFSEITSIVEDCLPEKVTVIQCDTRIVDVTEYTVEDMPIEDPTAKGRGGTDFRPPFKHVDKEELNPVCFVYLSDMECSSYPDTPDYPVLWISTQKNYDEPPFGEVIRM
jgi:predicted metal-dependent peptidase